MSKSKSSEKRKQSSQVYDIECIIAHRVHRNHLEYRIRWYGYTKDEDTWQKEETIKHTSSFIEYVTKHYHEIKKLYPTFRPNISFPPSSSSTPITHPAIPLAKQVYQPNKNKKIKQNEKPKEKISVTTSSYPFTEPSSSGSRVVRPITSLAVLYAISRAQQLPPPPPPEPPTIVVQDKMMTTEDPPSDELPFSSSNPLPSNPPCTPPHDNMSDDESWNHNSLNDSEDEYVPDSSTSSSTHNVDLIESEPLPSPPCSYDSDDDSYVPMKIETLQYDTVEDIFKPQQSFTQAHPLHMYPKPQSSTRHAPPSSSSSGTTPQSQPTMFKYCEACERSAAGVTKGRQCFGVFKSCPYAMTRSFSSLSICDACMDTCHTCNMPACMRCWKVGFALKEGRPCPYCVKKLDAIKPHPSPSSDTDDSSDEENVLPLKLPVYVGKLKRPPPPHMRPAMFCTLCAWRGTSCCSKCGELCCQSCLTSSHCPFCISNQETITTPLAGKIKNTDPEKELIEELGLVSAANTTLPKPSCLDMSDYTPEPTMNNKRKYLNDELLDLLDQ